MGLSVIPSYWNLAGIGIGVLTAAYSLSNVSSLNTTFRKSHSSELEGLYLPSNEAVTFLTFGHRNAGGHLMWFKTINYFGKHFATDRDLQWLPHLCSLAVTLNPKARHPYQFCANMLSWEANNPKGAVTVLDRAVEAFPTDWFFLYLRGFTKLYFLKDSIGARNDFILSARQEKAPPLVARLAAKQMAQTDAPEAAIEFLQGMLATERDPRARAALLLRLKDAIRGRDIALLQQAITKYKQKTGNVPDTLEDLVNSGIVTSLGNDPDGRKYMLDKNSGKIHTISPDSHKKVVQQ